MPALWLMIQSTTFRGVLSQSKQAQAPMPRLDLALLDQGLVGGKACLHHSSRLGLQLFAFVSQVDAAEVLASMPQRRCRIVAQLYLL